MTRPLPSLSSSGSQRIALPGGGRMKLWLGSKYVTLHLALTKEKPNGRRHRRDRINRGYQGGTTCTDSQKANDGGSTIFRAVSSHRRDAAEECRQKSNP